MSLNDAGNYNNNKDRDYRVTVYSSNTFSNVDSTIEKSKLTYTFWKGLLKISIAPMIPSNDDSVNFDYKKESSIYLSPMLASMGYKKFKEFMENPDKFESRSIPTRSGALIKLCKGEQYGIKGHVLVIEKIGEDRSIIGGHLYEFNTDKYYGIDNINEDDFSFDKSYYKDLEIDFLLLTLKSFYEYSVGSSAYFNMDYNRFEQSRLTGKLNKIGIALNIEDKSGYNKGYGGSKNSPFESNKNNNSSSNNDEYSYNDIEEQLE